MPSNQMVSHYCVNHVLRPSLGHVTTNAIRRRRVFAQRHCLPQRQSVAGSADAVIAYGSLFASLDIVRIMTRRAGELSAALQKALRLAQPVSRVHNLKIVFGPARRRTVEEDHKVAQRLT